MNVKTLCLGILHFGDATGYEINKKASEGEFSHFIEASYGSIYPALMRLTEDGLVTWREEHQPGKPARKIYSITVAGSAALIAALGEQPRPDVFKSEFLFLSLFVDLIGETHLQRAIDMRMELHRTEIARLKEAAGRCQERGSQFAIGYGIALGEAAIAYLANARSHLNSDPVAGAERPSPAISA